MAIVSVVLSFLSCSENDEFGCRLLLNLNLNEAQQAQLSKDIEIIDTYLSDSSITAQIDSTGLRYVINNPGVGSGQPIGLCDQVRVFYEGRLLSNGSKFDGTGKEPAAFVLGGLITGWQIGIPLVQPGGSVTLYIPSVYGYGELGTSSGSIPANANLIFDIELVSVN